MTPQDMLDLARRYTAEGLQNHGYVTRNDLSLREVRDATLTSRVYHPDRSYVGAVYDGKGELVRSTLRFNERDIFPVDPQHLDPIATASARPAYDRVAIYGGILFPILGHFYFESLARLWPLTWARSVGAGSVPVYFHPWPGLDPAALIQNPLYRDSFKALGIEASSLRVIDAPTRIDTLIIPDPASAYHINLDERMISVFDRISTSILGQSSSVPIRVGAGRKAYLSRSMWTDNRRILNEEAIDAELAQRGFEIVHTQAMSPHELMTLLVNADLIVSTDGSHAHMAAFCRPGTRMVLLDTRPVPTQFAISLLRHMRAVHVPLFQTPIYRMEVGITDPSVLAQLIDLCITETDT